VIPDGTGISKIPTPTNSTTPQRRSLLRELILSADSWSVLSGGAVRGCSTQSSF
jgi:hypothetical protein